MKSLKVSEVFYSLQGEGFRAGHPSIFVRLSGCDLACGFCDTEFESGKEMNQHEVLTAIMQAIQRTAAVADVKCWWIVWTGGEPTLQLTAEHVKFFSEYGYRQAIETNGNHPVPAGLDWVACSPKVAEHVLEKNFPNGVDELRYVRHSGQPGVPQPKVATKQKYLSPMFRGDRVDPENLNHCIKLCLQNPDWKLSVQTHKLTKIL